MHFTPRAAQVRNLSIAAVNGLVTLVILLIAPLGLFAVIINTALVMVATYGTATVGDRIIQYLMGNDARRGRLTSESRAAPLRTSELSTRDRLEDE